MKELKISLHKSGMQFVAFTNQSDIKMTGKKSAVAPVERT